MNAIGYSGNRLEADYQFGDWFTPGTPERIVELAAFGRTPVAFDSACFAVIASNGKPGRELIRECRALGAPRAFEVDTHGRVFHWRVAISPSDGDRQQELQPERVAAEIEEHKGEWSPDAMLRAKNVGPSGPRQRDFIDLGLVPAIEEQVREKIDPLLSDILNAAQNEYSRRTGKHPSPTNLFQLVFRALAGKIMHDREVPGFSRGRVAPAAGPFLDRVAAYYNEPGPAAIGDPIVQQLVVDRLWAGVNLKNISVEALAYVWENTLLTPADRRAKGIHATPPSIARYIVRRLFPDDASLPGCVVEPCCGAATFLIAAMQRLRELLPHTMSDRERHKYFKRVLYGFDTEPFGLEVAKCRLMLADFPHPNRWNLFRQDVFAPEGDAPRFASALREADVVLCNPPFGSFSPYDRDKYGAKSPFKQVELFGRVLDELPPHGMLGFVMPLQLLSGKSYRSVRARLAERYGDIEVVSLPDKVFDRAEQETALVIAKGGRSGLSPSRVLHRKVSDAGWVAFRDRYEATSEGVGATTPDDAAFSLALPDLPEVWNHLAGLPRLKDATDLIRRGIEWTLPLDENREKLISSTKREGFQEGLPSPPRGGVLGYQCPPTSFLCTKPEYHRRAFDLPWDRPKVVMSAKRRRRSPWRIAAFPDRSGLVCYQTFTAVWPTAGWSPETLAAILNSPVANAFVAAREGNRDNTNEIVADVPIPLLSKKTSRFVDDLVVQYMQAVSESLFSTSKAAVSPRQLLLTIDAVILKAYGLSPELEASLLDYFGQAWSDRPIPDSFGIYTPEAINRAYAAVKDGIEPPGTNASESWEYLKKVLDEDRSPKRKLFL